MISSNRFRFILELFLSGSVPPVGLARLSDLIPKSVWSVCERLRIEISRNDFPVDLVSAAFAKSNPITTSIFNLLGKHADS